MEFTDVAIECVRLGLGFTVVLITLSAVDDFVVDFLSFALRRKTLQRRGMTRAYRPKIYVCVANWHEANVLENMISGNLRSIIYRPLKFILGVYPNDPETLAVARRLERRFKPLVRVVVNPIPGPTSKGQMQNVLISDVFKSKKLRPDLVVVHDAEDVIDPLSFYHYAKLSKKFDYIQIPVFSLDSRNRSWVGAHYMEEFAERHSREMRVRSDLGAMIPSAGVGTCMTAELIQFFLCRRGFLFRSDCVTEDYVLGAEVRKLGFRACFGYTSFGRPYIATREYFPKNFWASVKQKSRWTFGIAFQGTRQIGWFGGFWDRYFLYRDRKGLAMNLVPPMALCFALSAQWLGGWDELSLTLALLNTGLTGVRYVVKRQAVKDVYGYADSIGIALRWPIIVTINFLAACFAWKTFFASRFATKPVGWAKTDHELPFDARSDASTRSHEAATPSHSKIDQIRSVRRTDEEDFAYLRYSA
jgi:Glycosyltransferase like family 2